MKIVYLRLEEVRKFCEKQIAHEYDPAQPLALTNRGWACQSILNILDGNIDQQLIEENNNRDT